MENSGLLSVLFEEKRQHRIMSTDETLQLKQPALSTLEAIPKAEIYGVREEWGQGTCRFKPDEAEYYVEPCCSHL